MSNVQNELPQNEQTPQEPELTFPQYVAKLLRDTWAMLKTAVILAPIFLILIVVILALMGPSIGNIFSNVVSAL